MRVTDYDDYKAFLRALMKTFPKRGRGQSRRLAEHLSVAPIVVSQILARDRHFTPEQAIRVAGYFGLDERSAEYFVFMVNLARADSKELKTFYREKLDKLKTEAENIRNLVVGKGVLSEDQKGIYYSNWYYAAVQILSSIKEYQTVDAIAGYLSLPRGKIGEVVSFLLETGLCVEDKFGKIGPGPKSIHVDSKSPFVNSHRRNWRDKAKEKFSNPGPTDMFYSAVQALSVKDSELFKQRLLRLIEEFSKQVEPSPEETSMCLNIDWFKF